MGMLDDHVIAITGAGSGLGLGVLRYCFKEGAKAAVMEIAPEKCDSLRAEFGDDLLVFEGDVSKLDKIEAFRGALVDRFGRLDSLISCQGIFDGNVPIKNIPADKLGNLFDELFTVNVKSNFLLVKSMEELLLASQGAIVLTVSSAAYAADGGGLAYTATKGALKSMVSQLAYEFAPTVRVTGVAPSIIGKSQLRGPAALGMDGWKQSDIPIEAFQAGIKATTLMGHIPEPDDYGPIYAFLASRANRIMTGQTVLADQGALNRALINAPHVLNGS